MKKIPYILAGHGKMFDPNTTQLSTQCKNYMEDVVSSLDIHFIQEFDGRPLTFHMIITDRPDKYYFECFYVIGSRLVKIGIIIPIWKEGKEGKEEIAIIREEEQKKVLQCMGIRKYPWRIQSKFYVEDYIYVEHDEKIQQLCISYLQALYMIWDNPSFQDAVKTSYRQKINSSEEKKQKFDHLFDILCGQDLKYKIGHCIEQWTHNQKYRESLRLTINTFMSLRE